MNPGDLLGERYELIDLIGVGGMGEVWRAKHVTLGREVAVKVLHIGQGRPLTIQRFQREAELVAKVEHRNVIDVIDFGTTPDGLQFLVMPFLVGETLARRLHREPAATLAEILSIVRSVLSGLAAIHDAGVIHRDLKPANIFLVRDADGIVPKLLDFGVSRDATTPDAAAPLTLDGAMMGTPQYMAPEQFESARTVDARADLYSIGVILYEALAGRPPYDGSDPFGIYRSILAKEAKPIAEVRPDVPAAMCALVDRAIAHEAGARFQSARDMRAALDGLVRGGELAGVSLADFPTIQPAPTPESFGTAPTAMAESSRPPPNPARGPESQRLSSESPRVQAAIPALSSESPRMQVALPSARAPAARKLGLKVALGGIAALGVLGGAWMLRPSPTAPPLQDRPAQQAVLQPTEPDAPPPLGSDEARAGSTSASSAGAAEAPSETTTWTVIGEADQLRTLAIRWGRLSERYRRLSVRFVVDHSAWKALAADVPAELAQELSNEFRFAAPAQTWSGATDEFLTPQLMHTTARLNVHVGADRDSRTAQVLPHDTLVVSVQGMIDGQLSSDDEEDELGYVAFSLEAEGWVASRLLELHGGCIPLPGALVRDRALPDRPVQRGYVSSLTTIHLGGTQRRVYMLAARDRSSARSAIGFYEAGDECDAGEPLALHRIPGVLDEYFLTDTPDGETLLVASWHPQEHPPSSGIRSWAAYRISNPAPVWQHTSRTAPSLSDRPVDWVKGTRDLLLGRYPGYQLASRTADSPGPDSPRRWFRWQNGRLVEAAAPTGR